MVKWPALSHEKLEEAESALIAMSGVPMEPMRIYLEDSENYSIFCLKCGDPEKPSFVLLHGYLGTSIIFYKTLQHLCETYYVYCLDLMGMGRSSRPEFTAKGREETEHFFVWPLEQCRIKLGLEKMILAGHSFGGYVAGCYTESFPDRVEKLVLISSIGIPSPPDNKTPKEWAQALSWKFRLLIKVAKYIVGKGFTPAELLRKLGPFSGGFVRNYMRRRWKNIPEAELDHLEIYLEQVNLYPGSGEFALKELFVEGAFAIKPLYDRITHTPVLYIYGDKDWMDPRGAEMNALHNSCTVICETITNSGHHMYIDNPSELADKIVSALNRL